MANFSYSITTLIESALVEARPLLSVLSASVLSLTLYCGQHICKQNICVKRKLFWRHLVFIPFSFYLVTCYNCIKLTKFNTGFGDRDDCK